MKIEDSHKAHIKRYLSNTQIFRKEFKRHTILNRQGKTEDSHKARIKRYLSNTQMFRKEFKRHTILNTNIYKCTLQYYMKT